MAHSILNADTRSPSLSSSPVPPAAAGSSSLLSGVGFTALTSNSSFVSNHATPPYTLQLTAAVHSRLEGFKFFMKLPSEADLSNRLKLLRWWKRIEQLGAAESASDGISSRRGNRSIKVVIADTHDDEDEEGDVLLGDSEDITDSDASAETLCAMHALRDLRLLRSLWCQPVDICRHQHRWLLLHSDRDLTLMDTLTEHRCVLQQSPTATVVESLVDDMSSWISASWRQRCRLWKQFVTPVVIRDPTHQGILAADADGPPATSSQTLISFSPFFPRCIAVTEERRFGLRSVFLRALRNVTMTYRGQYGHHNASPNGSASYERWMHMFDETHLAELGASPYLSPQRAAGLWRSHQHCSTGTDSTKVLLDMHPADDVWNAAVVALEFALAGWLPSAASDSSRGHSPNKRPLSPLRQQESGVAPAAAAVPLFTLMSSLLSAPGAACSDIGSYLFIKILAEHLRDPLCKVHHQGSIVAKAASGLAVSALHFLTSKYGSASNLLEHHGGMGARSSGLLQTLGEMLIWERKARWTAFKNRQGLEEDDEKAKNGSEKSPESLLRQDVDTTLADAAIVPLLPTLVAIPGTHHLHHRGDSLLLRCNSTVVHREYDHWKFHLERATLVDSGALGATQAKHSAVFLSCMRMLKMRDMNFTGAASPLHSDDAWISSKRTSGGCFRFVTLVCRVTLSDPFFYYLVSSAQRSSRLLAAAPGGVQKFTARHSATAYGALDVASYQSAVAFVPEPQFLAFLREDSEKRVTTKRSTTLDNLFGDRTKKLPRSQPAPQSSSFRSPGLSPSASPATKMAALRSPSSHSHNAVGSPQQGASDAGSVAKIFDLVIQPHELRNDAAATSLLHATRDMLLRYWAGDIQGPELIQFLKKAPYIVPTLRSQIWNALLLVGTAEEASHRSPSQRSAMLRGLLEAAAVEPNCNDRQISVDIPRCHQYNAQLSSVDGHAKLSRVLKTWLQLNPTYTYWQGVDSVCATLLSVSFDDEALVVSSLHSIIAKYVPHFFVSGVGTMDQRLSTFTHLLRYHDPFLANHMERIDCRPDLYSISWFLTLFAHVLPLRKIYIVWDAMLLSSSPNWICCLAVVAVMQLRDQLVNKDFSSCITILSNMHGFDLLDAVEEANLLVAHTPSSILNPPFHTNVGRSLIQTSSVAMMDPEDLEYACGVGIGGECGIQPKHWSRSGVFIIDVRSRDETVSGGAHSAADPTTTPSASNTSSFAGVSSTAAVVASLPRSHTPPPPLPVSSSDHNAQYTRNAKGSVVYQINGALRCPYDGVDGWNVDAVIPLLMKPYLCALRSVEYYQTPRHRQQSPSNAINNNSSSSRRSSHADRPQEPSMSSILPSSAYPHVIVVAGYEPECGQSACVDLLQHGISNVSMLIGGVDAMVKHAPSMVIKERLASA